MFSVLTPEPLKPADATGSPTYTWLNPPQLDVNGYYRDIASKASALVESMSGNHGFTDGNKWTTIILTHLLLSRSGYRLRPLRTDGPLDVAMEELVLAVVRHELIFDQIVSWFEDRLCRL
jgi:death on curing protein